MATPADRSSPREDGRISTRIRSPSSPPRGSQTAAERLTDDLIIEILSRVPAKSLCRFKCVSKHWLGLTNDRSYRKKLPQTLTGFYQGIELVDSALPFTNLSGSRHLTYPAFVPNRGRVKVLDSCNGLLLCRSYVVCDHGEKMWYVVFNPATEEWAELPKCRYYGPVATKRLCFDPAVSPHFHVFLLLAVDDLHGDYLTGVHVYSSETGSWVHKKKRWSRNIDVANDLPTIYLNGYLHFCANVDGSAGRLAAVDKEGRARTNFRVPGGLDVGFIQLSQGCLHYAGFHTDDDSVVRMQVYVLKDYDRKEWILKHSVETSHLLGGRHVKPLDEDFDWIAIHPECDLIFFAVAQEEITFMCYDMRRGQVTVICNNLEDSKQEYFPYVPLYEELKSLHK
ncbi:F-box protein At5g07610-like isoform X1 [Hordeum vulgare subsp. vulgare]|uniref:F-box domain-containing protein n=1 Tax=Hordeum vulgare subsp. vulgare TaxID=112509 RepID=A0A8I6Z864_HORVV|nr:F-box protein At5g07610-like isoform X1 [Hordeum vulgare subsp. vulgare]